MLPEIHDSGARRAAQREAEEEGGGGEGGRVVVDVGQREKDPGQRLVLGIVRDGGGGGEEQEAATSWRLPLENGCGKERNNYIISS